MIITLKRNIPVAEKDKLIASFENEGLALMVSEGVNYTILGLIGDTTKIDEKRIQANPWVDSVQRIAAKYKLANRMFHPKDTIVNVNGIKVGGSNPIVVIGGPCAVEGKNMIIDISKKVKSAGAIMLRGGAFKPRTSPYAFQGLGMEGIEYMNVAKDKTGLAIVSELMSIEHLSEFVEKVDLVQIGARNMQNFELLKAVGKINKPVLLKRGLANTIEEWIMSAEYIMANGNPNVILCERGIRTFEPYTRNTLDVSVIPIIKEKTHLPIIVDPSHATGDWKLVEAMSLAAIAAGVDGLIIEVHENPECAWSDGSQSLKPEKFRALMKKGKLVAKAIGREM